MLKSTLRIACAFTLVTATTLPLRSREAITITAPLASTTPDSETTGEISISYRPYELTTAKPLAQLKREIGEERLALVLKLNRIDAGHLRTGETLLIPEQDGDLSSLSPFPREFALAREIPQLLVVSRRIQAFGAYEFGRLVRWGPTSTGKKATPTPAGLYHANWKAKATRSTVNQEWLLRWYVNLDNQKGIAIHEYELPGYPASHACVRMFADDAAWFYSWSLGSKLSADNRQVVAYGTPVIVFGAYRYGEKPPWKQLAADSCATTVTGGELEQTFLPYQKTIRQRSAANAADPLLEF